MTFDIEIMALKKVDSDTGFVSLVPSNKDTIHVDFYVDDDVVIKDYLRDRCGIILNQDQLTLLDDIIDEDLMEINDDLLREWGEDYYAEKAYKVFVR